MQANEVSDHYWTRSESDVIELYPRRGDDDWVIPPKRRDILLKKTFQKTPKPIENTRDTDQVGTPLTPYLASTTIKWQPMMMSPVIELDLDKFYLEESNFLYPLKPLHF